MLDPVGCLVLLEKIGIEKTRTQGCSNSFQFFNDLFSGAQQASIGREITRMRNTQPFFFLGLDNEKACDFMLFFDIQFLFSLQTFRSKVLNIHKFLTVEI